MADQEKKTTSRLPTGMIKRANPLSLASPKEEKKPLVKASERVTKSIKKSTVSLTGPKGFWFFLPKIDQALLATIKGSFPDLKPNQLLEQGLLTLLQEEKPSAYQALLKTLKKGE